MKKVTVLYKKNLCTPITSEEAREARDMTEENAEKTTELYDEIGMKLETQETVQLEKEWIESEWAEMQDLKGNDDQEDKEILQEVWKMFNRYELNPLSAQNQPGGEEDQPVLEENDVGHTSMSVGDMVRIGETLYIACSVGWAEVEVVQ